MSKPIIADLFCGAGGAALGLRQAGFKVIGFDIQKPSVYLGDEFVQCDLNNPPFKDLFWADAVWCSPPCQRFSTMTARWKYEDHPDLIPLTRQLVSGHSYTVIENVCQAPIKHNLKLWGGNFGLGATHDRDGLWRPRAFELSFFAWQLPKPKLQKGRTLTITKRLSARCHYYRRKVAGLPGKVSRAEALEVMGYPKWVENTPITENEIAESVPPPYARYIGLECLARMRETGYVPLSERRSQVFFGLVSRSAIALDCLPF